MTTLHDTLGTSTVASMFHSDGKAHKGTVPNSNFTILGKTMPDGANEVPLPVGRTAAGPDGEIPVPEKSTVLAIMEIRRLSGLTWEELGTLFDVSRRSIHNWANGKRVSAGNDQMISRMLAAIRHLDQGDQADTRALLLTVDQTTGFSTLDLLKKGRFDEAVSRVGST